METSRARLIGEFSYKHKQHSNNHKLSKKLSMWCGGLALLALCAGCQGRQANPVSMVQPGDDELTCAQLTGEIKGNNVQIRHLSGKDEEVEVGNAIAVVVFPFGIDLSSKEQIEMRALLDRNRQLDRIRKTRDCAA